MGGLEIFKYIGSGLLVTVGFIDPGNWASNLAAGAQYGYTLLWMVTLSTVMLIVLQHNVAHLGIATGLCLSEAASAYLKPAWSRPLLGSAVLASISTSLAEILGGAIALQMLFGVPVRIGALLVLVFVVVMLFTNSYRLIEKWIIAFVSIIGLSFIYELSLVTIDWPQAARAWVTPSFPEGSMVIIMSVLGAVVMPHNLFLHSEVIQSRQWNLSDDAVIRRQLRYEYADTIFSMLVGWAINSAMILLAACTAVGLLVIYLLRPGVINFVLLLSAVLLARGLLDFLLNYVMWGYDHVWMVFVYDVLPGVIYTVAVSPLVYYLYTAVHAWFEGRMEA